MSETSPVAPGELPGRPFEYYLTVLRRRWRLVVAGLLIGLIAGAGFLLVRPQSVTASSVVQLSIITSDPFGLDRAPSSLLDVGTEQQVARSFLVAQRASAMMDERLSPTAVRAASEASVGQQATVVTISFTTTDEELSRSGADAVATSFLEVRGEQVDDRIGDQLTVIDDRLLELQSEQADLLDAMGESGDPDSVLESREQLIRNEIQALVQQRTNLNSVSTSGGRVLTAADAAEVAYSPSRLLVIAASSMAGLLAGVALAFVRQGMARRFRDASEVHALTGAPVLAAGQGPARWLLPGAILVGMLPDGDKSLTLVSLTNDEDLEQVDAAIRQAVAQDPSSTLSLATMDGRFTSGAFSLAELRNVDAAAVIVSPRTTEVADLRQLVDVLRMLDVDLVLVFWCSLSRVGRGQRRIGQHKRSTT